MRIVRPAAEHDLDAICDLVNWAILHTTAHFATKPESIESMRELWRRSHEHYPWLVCEVDGAFAGFAKGGKWNPRCAYAWACETTVYVRPEYRRRGVGRALYERLFAILRAQGYRTLVAGITLPNPASVALHEAMGMRRGGLFPQMGYKFGRWHDVGYWVLPLGNGPPGEILPVSSVLSEPDPS